MFDSTEGGPDSRIEVVHGGLRVGGLATLDQIGASPLVEHLAGVLAQACLAAASAQVRDRATIAGNDAALIEQIFIDL